MPMPAVPVVVSSRQREGLGQALRSRRDRVARRARAIELASRAKSISEIAAATGYSEEGVRLLKHRWNERGLRALQDAPRSGRPRRVRRRMEIVEPPVEDACELAPADRAESDADIDELRRDAFGRAGISVLWFSQELDLSA